MEYQSYAYQNDLANAQLYAHDIIGNLNAGMNLFFDWNLLLNQKGGPNYAGNYCDAPILCDVKRNSVARQLSYTYLGHFSKHILPGAKAHRFYAVHLSSGNHRFPEPGQYGRCGGYEPNRLGLPIDFRLNGEMSVIESPSESIMTVQIQLAGGG